MIDDSLAKDQDFLSYVLAHSQTERHLFSLAHCQRLLNLAGNPPGYKIVEPLVQLGGPGSALFSEIRYDVAQELVKLAHERMATPLWKEMVVNVTEQVRSEIEGEKELAFALGEERYIKPKDVHTETARRIFNLGPDKEPTKDQRDYAKRMNYGAIYGQRKGVFINMGTDRDDPENHPGYPNLLTTISSQIKRGGEKPEHMAEKRAGEIVANLPGSCGYSYTQTFLIRNALVEELTMLYKQLEENARDYGALMDKGIAQDESHQEQVTGLQLEISRLRGGCASIYRFVTGNDLSNDVDPLHAAVGAVDGLIRNYNELKRESSTPPLAQGGVIEKELFADDAMFSPAEYYTNPLISPCRLPGCEKDKTQSHTHTIEEVIPKFIAELDRLNQLNGSLKSGIEEVAQRALHPHVVKLLESYRNAFFNGLNWESALIAEGKKAAVYVSGNPEDANKIDRVSIAWEAIVEALMLAQEGKRLRAAVREKSEYSGNQVDVARARAVGIIGDVVIKRDAEGLRDRIAAVLLEQDEEVARLKRGEFTDDEFQQLCHNIDDTDREKFCDGCSAYQRKLFGESREDELRSYMAFLSNLSLQKGFIIPTKDTYFEDLCQLFDQQAAKSHKVPGAFTNRLALRAADYMRRRINPLISNVMTRGTMAQVWMTENPNDESVQDLGRAFQAIDEMQRVAETYRQTINTLQADRSRVLMCNMQHIPDDFIRIGRRSVAWVTGDPEDANTITSVSKAWRAIILALDAGEDSRNKQVKAEALLYKCARHMHKNDRILSPSRESVEILKELLAYDPERFKREVSE